MSAVAAAFDGLRHERALCLVNPYSFLFHQYFNLATTVWPTVLNLLTELKLMTSYRTDLPRLEDRSGSWQHVTVHHVAIHHSI